MSDTPENIPVPKALDPRFLDLMQRFQKSETFSASTLVEDPETGFLVSKQSQDPVGLQANGRSKVGPGNGPLLVFDAKKKQEFLGHLMILFPDISECAKLVGITRQTYRNHYNVDKKFREYVDEIAEIHVDRVEAERFRMALAGKSGALDRMAVLNAYRRERYNPSIQVEVQHKMTADESLRRSKQLGNVIDAEIVNRVHELKRLHGKPTE